ncbi:contactin-2 [Protopterus annectens]|uniref:contactin-2 n=1 Tax=Protopterus annectens TaxID=7888 RepID=UPI001CFA13E2|nr:contactin-2 [Protopterus annectens]XP_043932734.1 contactin-2 [Protopterus annectens]
MGTSILEFLVILAIMWVTVCGIMQNYATFGPVFEEQPDNTLFPEESEEQVSLQCQARASPPATYRWKVNGTELATESDTHYSLIGGNLVIMKPDKAKHSGSYQCIASNSMGTIVSKEAHLRFGYLQWFSAEERNPVTSKEGLGTVISCNPPPHYPGLSYRWLLNEFPKFISPDGRHFISQVTGNLYFAKTEAADKGAYSCLATSNAISKSSFSKFIQLNVFNEGESKQYPPSIKAKFPPENYVLTGQTVNLECFAFGNPVPQIKWRKVDGTLSPEWKVTEPVLQITNIGFEEEGTYECEAENAKGKDVFRGRVIVQAQPEWLQVITDTEADVESDLQWTCAAAGKPRPSVRWLRNGQPLLSKNHVDVNGGTLRITKLTKEDAGMYQCVAENKHGTIYTNAELKVLILAPDFRMTPVRPLIPAARGGEVFIKCQPRAAPKPLIFWSKGTELLTNSSSTVITLDGSLWIKNISKRDEGKYTCFAENSLGKANSTGTLSVREATKITLAPTSADIKVGESATLQCHASHDPTMDLTFTWSLDSSLINFDKEKGHYLRPTENETIGDLTIVNAQLKHSGNYTCTAQSVVDSSSASAVVVVRGPPGPPGGIVVKNVYDTSVELSWSRGYDNHSPIGKYTIEAQTLLSSQWKQAKTVPTTIEGNRENAQVISLVPWMDYRFRVTATNILGTGEPSMPSSVVRTKEAAPMVAPSGLSGGGGDPHELIINWMPMAQEYQYGNGFGYILAFRKMGSTDWQSAKVPNAQSSRYVYKNETIAPYTPFEVKIKGYNSQGEGPYSQTATVYSAEEVPKLVPSNVTANAFSSQEISMTWNPVQQTDTNGILQGYEIKYWKANENEAAANRVRTAGLETQARIPGLLPNTLYSVAVSVYNSAGAGPPSAAKMVTTKKALPSQPPSSITWKNHGSRVTIMWDHVKAHKNESAVQGYKVLHKQEGHAIPKLYTTTKNSIQLPLPDDNSYMAVEVRAVGEGGEGPPAEVIISKDAGTGMMVHNPSTNTSAHGILTATILMLVLIGWLEL